jgi:hypothetical protein
MLEMAQLIPSAAIPIAVPTLLLQNIHYIFGPRLFLLVVLLDCTVENVIYWNEYISILFATMISKNV